jgi:hypothetical protein
MMIEEELIQQYTRVGDNMTYDICKLLADWVCQCYDTQYNGNGGTYGMHITINLIATMMGEEIDSTIY